MEVKMPEPGVLIVKHKEELEHLCIGSDTLIVKESTLELPSKELFRGLLWMLGHDKKKRFWLTWLALKSIWRK